MNLLTWNCAMAFRKKYHHVLDFKPDVMVIQECEHKDKLPIQKLQDEHGLHQVIWYGKNPHKGIAVLAYGEVELSLMEEHDPQYEYVLPIKMKVHDQMINLFAIWAMPHSTRSKGYVGQVWGAINHYRSLLDHPSILVGDFNSHPIWDHKYPKGCHTDVVSFLKDKEILSTYHQSHGVSHGQETDPTFFLTKKLTKPYHLDYCFVSSSLMNIKTKVTVGSYDDWISKSDHMPVSIQHLDC